MNSKRLLELRERAGLSQQALAARSGVEQAVISRAEAGKRGVTSVTLRLIAEALAAELAEDVGTVLKALTDPR